MMLHSVCLIADDDGENKAVRSHVLSSNLSGTARRPPATNTSREASITNQQKDNGASHTLPGTPHT